jgi:hypothetical protein
MPVREGRKGLELEKNGEIEVHERSASSAQREAGEGDTRPTQAEFDQMILHAVEVVTRALGPNSPSEAVAEVVKGYMVAFVKGDFIHSVNEKVESEDSDSPF